VCKREWREIRAIANTEDLFRGSSNLLCVFAFTAMKDIHYARTSKIPQCYKFPQELSDSQVTHSFP